MDTLVTLIRKLTFLEYRRKRRRQRRTRRDCTIAKKISQKHGNNVLSGPFKGIKYASLTASGSCLCPKLIGSYEKEIHQFIEQLIKTNHNRIINIGCGEGFYAVGMAMRMPNSQIFAFDENERARKCCEGLAIANGVENRVAVGGKCCQNDLIELISSPSIIICDCEGCEIHILKPDAMKTLQHCDILVELHQNNNDNNTVELITSRFKRTHKITLKEYGSRNLASYPNINFLHKKEQQFALDENRSRGMHWALLRVKR